MKLIEFIKALGYPTPPHLQLLADAAEKGRSLTISVRRRRPMTHYYVYYRDPKGRAVYERTCGSEHGANGRVKELTARGHEAWWQTTIYPDALY